MAIASMWHFKNGGDSMRVLAALFIVVLISGCETIASNKPLVFMPSPGHESLTREDFLRAKWICLRDTQNTPLYFNSCMAASGWIPEK
jgi:hypothetical protein